MVDMELLFMDWIVEDMRRIYLNVVIPVILGILVEYTAIIMRLLHVQVCNFALRYNVKHTLFL